MEDRDASRSGATDHPSAREDDPHQRAPEPLEPGPEPLEPGLPLAPGVGAVVGAPGEAGGHPPDGVAAQAGPSALAAASSSASLLPGSARSFWSRPCSSPCPAGLAAVRAPGGHDTPGRRTQAMRTITPGPSPRPCPGAAASLNRYAGPPPWA